MNQISGSLRISLTALLLASLAQPACSDDNVGPLPASGGASDTQGGADTSGENGGSGDEGGTSANGGSNGGPMGGSGDADAGEPGKGPQGGASSSDGGAPPEGAAGSEGTVPCAGEVIDDECFETAFARVQSATQSLGSGATTDTVKLLQDTVAGNTLLLSVGVIWNGTAQPITAPAGFTLIERADNTTGTSTHESAALYLAESAPALAAATGATVTVGDAQARIYLGLTEYAGLRASGVLDRSASSSGSGSPTPGTTAQTTAAAELWVVVTVSRGGGGHSAPTNGFEIASFKNTGAGSFSMLEKLVQARGAATASLSGSGDYASVIATLRR